ncbi:VP3 [Sea otter polyomavirus 1]|nr:VP3 [Sea otter polyomavirus 1]AIS40922.1 VP3 [Sea otter polyomavirus 1]
MALQVWYPDFQEMLFPGVNSLVRALHYIDPREWAASLYAQLRDLFGYGPARLGYSTTEVGQATGISFRDSVARLLEEVTWAVSSAPLRTYQFLADYYSSLSHIRPSMVRQIAQSHGPLPSKFIDYKNLDNGPFSGELVDKAPPPGGANQRVTPDWLLPLILDLYGPLNPSWKEEEDDGPQKKIQRTNTRAKAPNKRRNRGSGGQKRARKHSRN